MKRSQPGNKCLPGSSGTAPGFHRLEKDAEQDEANAEVEGEVDFATLAKDEEGEDDGVAGFEIICQIDGEGRETLQGLNLKQIHTYGTEERVTEHEPEIRAFRDNYDRLLDGEKQEIDGDDGRYDDEATRHLVHQHRPASDTNAGLLVADGIEGADCRRGHTNHDAITIAGIKREDTKYTSYRNQRKEQFKSRKALFEDHWLEESREESDE